MQHTYVGKLKESPFPAYSPWKVMQHTYVGKLKG